MSEKDTIKDLFSDKLNGLESKVRPEMWGNISSQLGGASVASNVSVLTKIVLGVTAAAAVAVVGYFLLNGQKENQKPTTSTEKSPTSNGVKETNILEENQQTEQQQDPILSLDFPQEITAEESSPISFDPETPQEYFDALETVVVEAEQETQQETQSRVSEQTHSVTETTEKEVIEVSTSSLEIILPNAFTPNGDGVNETLQLNISEDKLTPGTFSFVVIDRLGKTVYQTTDIHFEWEGVSMNGEVVLAGDYVYYVTARDIKGKLITKYSTLHIVR
jgi:gliding motility-associated-like protein